MRSARAERRAHPETNRKHTRPHAALACRSGSTACDAAGNSAACDAAPRRTEFFSSAEPPGYWRSHTTATRERISGAPFDRPLTTRNVAMTLASDGADLPDESVAKRLAARAVRLILTA